MSTNKNIVQDYLQMTSEEYNERKFQLYWAWCQKYGRTPNHIQQLLSNTAVSNWWNLEYAKLEDQFVKAVEFITKRKDQLEHHFHGFISGIFLIYPKPLIEAISKQIQNQEMQLIIKLPIYHAN